MLTKQNAAVSVDEAFAKNLRIAIVRTDYHQEWNDNLTKYCTETLVNNGVLAANVKAFSVPGSWEIPLMAQKLAKSQQFDAIVTFGVIIKGDTYHFEMLANEVARALMQLSLDYSLPIALEVLAMYSNEQAEARAGDNEQNKGIEAAVAVLKALQALKNA